MKAPIIPIRLLLNSKKIILAVTFLIILLLPTKGWTQVKTFTVNMTSDESDPNAGNIGDDGACDVDPTKPGDQCTLRAAIENQNGNRNLPRRADQRS